jgi:hypothetical protein
VQHTAIPSLEDISSFFREVFVKSQMESDCIIMSLIYVERLIKETNGGVQPHPTNWHSVLFSCMILASKGMFISLYYPDLFWYGTAFHLFLHFDTSHRLKITSSMGRS